MKTRAYFLFLLLVMSFSILEKLVAQMPVLEDSIQTKQISGLDFDPYSGDLILMGTDNRFIRFDPANRKQEVLSTTIRTGSASRMAVSAKGYLTVQQENGIDYVNLRSSDFTTGKSGKTRKDCLSFDITVSGNEVVYTDDNKLILTNLETRAFRQLYQNAEEKVIRFVRLFHQRPMAVLIYEDQTLELINYELGISVKVLPANFGVIQSLDINPEDTYLALGDQTGKIYIWNLAESTLVWTGSLHTHAITSLVFAPFGNFVYTRSLDNTIRMFRVPDGKEFFRLETTRPNYPVLSLSKGGTLLAFNNGNRHFRIFNLQPLLSDTLLAEAKGLMERKNYSVASQVLSTALYYHRDGRLYELRSQVFRQLGQSDSAISDLGQAITLKYNTLPNLNRRSELYFAKSRFAEALKDVDAVLAEMPLDTLALNLKIRVFFKNQTYRDIPALAEKLLPLIRDKKAVLDVCIQSLMNLRDYRSALPFLEQRLKISQEAELYFLRGQCYYLNDQFDKAAKDLLLNTKNMPGSVELTRFKAFAAFCDGGYEMAEPLFRECLLSDPRDPDCLNGQALCLMAGNRQEELQALMKDHLADSLNSWNRNFILAVHFIQQNKPEQVPEMLRTIYLQNPTYTFSPGNLLRFNLKQPDQRLISGLFSCLSASIQAKKPEFPARNVNETPADYNSRWQRVKQSIFQIIEECRAGYQQTALKIIAESKTTVQQPIGNAIENWDKTSGRLYLNIENHRFYIDKIDEVKYQAIQNEGQSVQISGYKQYAPDMVSWAYSDIQLTVPYFKEPLKAMEVNAVKAAKPAPAQASGAEDLAMSGQARGTRPAGTTSPAASGPAVKPYKNYLLLIAVDDYKYWNKLHTPVNDIKEFKEALLQRYYAFDSSTVFQLTNAQVTRSNILKVLNQLSQLITEDDRLIIYYAGHGAFNKFTNDGYWVPYDAAKEEWGDFFSYNDLKSYLRSFKSIHTLLINDACYSGLIASTRSPGVIANVDKKETRPSCTVFVSGLGDEEVSDQFLQTGHSPFAYWIITKLKENQQSALSFLDLAYFVSTRVSADSNKPQNPIFKTVDRSRDNDGQFFFHLKP